MGMLWTMNKCRGGNDGAFDVQMPPEPELYTSEHEPEYMRYNEYAIYSHISSVIHEIYISGRVDDWTRGYLTDLRHFMRLCNSNKYVSREFSDEIRSFIYVLDDYETLCHNIDHGVVRNLNLAREQQRRIISSLDFGGKCPVFD